MLKPKLDERILLVIDKQTRKDLDVLTKEINLSRAAFIRLLIRKAKKIKDATGKDFAIDELTEEELGSYVIWKDKKKKPLASTK